MGIQIPTETADLEFQTSTKITEQLADLIFAQEMDVSKLDEKKVSEAKIKAKADKETLLKAKFDEISAQVSSDMKRALLAAQEKGASAWLAALPIVKMGYALNKQEFRDAVCLRYGWKIKNTHNTCACGELNSIDHALVCKKGGYVALRHNALRDTEAALMDQVCKDVQIEPSLLPVGGVQLNNGANTADGARLDISARGIHGRNEKNLFDVRITHPNADSNKNKSLEQIYREHENEKKRLYNERVIQVERATLIPLVFTTSGGLGPECTKLNKKLAGLIAKKRNETYASVIKHIRTRLRFALLRSTLVALRGVRGADRAGKLEELKDISFNLIPEAACYEVGA